MATLDYYRLGSTPDAFATLPKDWTLDQIRQFQDYFDALMSGNSARRRMVKFMPTGFELRETRQPPLKDQYDEWLARVICYAFSIPPSPFVNQVNRPTSETLRVQTAKEGLVPLKAWVKSFLDQIVQVCLKQPDLEFVWIGDDAVDPLQQAQTLSLLVGAGIKTREEARAELGLAPEGPVGPAGAPSVAKYNHNHDERGRFSTPEDAVAPGAQAKPDAGVEVAANEDPTTMTDAGADVSSSSSASQGAGDGATNTPVTASHLTVVHEAPKDAVAFKSGDGALFLAPPKADFSQVFAAGRANGSSLFGANAAIGYFGTFDFQTDGDVFYTAYTGPSNYGVGVYMAGVGFSLLETIVLCKLFARAYSSNAGAQAQQDWSRRGWNDASTGSGPFSASP